MKKMSVVIALIWMLPVMGQGYPEPVRSVVINQTPCSGEEVQQFPALYYNHTKPKYGKLLNGPKAFSAPEEAKIINRLNGIEKLEEASRKNFQATGSVMRVSYSRGGKNIFGGYLHGGFGYQLGLYQMVCHVQQQVVKEVTEYRSVLRIDANHLLTEGSFYGDRGDFYISRPDLRYEIPVDAVWSATYDKDRMTKPARLSQFISEEMVLTGHSSDYRNKHAAFLKLVNGEGYTENWMAGDENKNNKYKWVDRYYTVTRPGLPLLVPVTRREFLESLLEYYEMEKYNFQKAAMLKAKSTPSLASAIEADKAAYVSIYETKKARIRDLLNTRGAGWLEQQVSVPYRGPRDNDYARASNGLFDLYDFESGTPLYQYNPDYFKQGTADPVRPVFFLVEFRYEGGPDRLWAENLLHNFEKNFSFDALKQMLE